MGNALTGFGSGIETTRQSSSGNHSISNVMARILLLEDGRSNTCQGLFLFSIFRIVPFKIYR